MLEDRRRKELACRFKITQYHRIRIFDENARPVCLFSHMALGIDQLHERNIVLASYAGIVFTEGRRAVNNTGTVCQRDIVITHDEECLVLALDTFTCKIKQRLVRHIFQILALAGREHLVSRRIAVFVLFFLLERPEHGVEQRFSHQIGVAVDRLDFRIGLIRVHTEHDVAGKRPRCGRPCEYISVLVTQFKADDRRAFLDILVALRHFVAGERCAAAWAVRDDLIALVEKTLLPDFLQCPPLGLDIIIVIGDIRVFHIGPETDLGGEILPHALVLPDTLLAVINKGSQSVLLDLLFSVEAEFLLDFYLHRQTVCVPSRLTGDHLPFHGMIAWNHILDDTRQHMSDMRLAVGCRRAVIKDIALVSFSLFDTLLKDLILIPEFFDVVFTSHEIQVCRYRFVHTHVPFLADYFNTFMRAGKSAPFRCSD